MRKIIITSIIAIIGLVIYMPQITLAESTPSITSITSTINSVNDTVTITGQGFNFSSTLPGYGPDNPSQNTLYCSHSMYGFFNMWENIISWNDTSIEFSFGGGQNFFTDTNQVNCYISFQGFYAPGESTDTNYNSSSVEVTLVAANTDTAMECSEWSACTNSSQTRICQALDGPQAGMTFVGTQACTVCTAWTYSDWGTCSTGNQQTRSVLTSSPTSCTGGSPVLTQSCTYTPPAPTCTADTWECEEWNSCSPSGIQSRSCTKTFDCPNVQTATPATDQFCAAPKPAQTAPSQSDEISNQDTIIKSTVKLLCPVDEYSASQGSGTVIDSNGTILTNKHVVAGTLGCLVGFIDDFGDEPYFGGRQIADIVKTSSSQDIAILKIRNPNNKKLSYVDTTDSLPNISLGTKITTYGYPAQFGTKITYTSGDFSGEDGSYLKTTAILEYGNSGGGAYLKNGTFVGIPSAVVKGELNALGYILSIDTINAWLGNSYIAYDDSSSNQYSRVSVLEDIDLNELDSLELFIPKTDEEGNITTPAQSNYFPDVPETHPNAVAIEVLRERNIINGYPDGTFKPENTVNRAELLKILVEGKIGTPDENEYKNCFPDITTQWFAPYVCYAKAENWVQGYPDGKFKPEQTVNKVEALKMLINSQKIATAETITSKPFDDVKTTDWFVKYVAKAKEMAILEETGSTFSPGEGMKRAGISENLYRLLIQ